jgi:hypothetical protein
MNDFTFTKSELRPYMRFLGVGCFLILTHYGIDVETISIRSGQFYAFMGNQFQYKENKPPV